MENRLSHIAHGSNINGCKNIYKLMQLFWRNIWECLLKFLTHRPFELEMLLLGVYTGNAHLYEGKSRSVFIAILFLIMKILKQPKCSLTGG